MSWGGSLAGVLGNALPRSEDTLEEAWEFKKNEEMSGRSLWLMEAQAMV